MSVKIILDGFLAKDPTWFDKKDGKGARFMIPVSRPGNKKKSDWYTVFISGGQVLRAEQIKLQKGDLVSIYGRFTPEFEEREGKTVLALNVNAVDFELKRHAKAKTDATGVAEAYEDEPEE